ncbi:NnrS family protein [Janthinobacterium fluminis]|uniref:NnrS family protein n=1 Tax=Janthinobacterium fluminis TaxID=2987524 RepID=A0ABT5K0D4_9BURK|nr:NnrS family protein [Janthinobacterium fluminis]MDC8757915.1 NnrS family protein [Janthinobacterium fluminis]
MPKFANHPLLLCGFRPFFLYTAGYAVLALGVWLLLLSGLLPAPDLAGGLPAWHAHEMIYGFAMASVAGFLLTAVPEFTGGAGFGRKRLLGLALLWLGARLAFGLSAWLGVWPAALCNLGLSAVLLATLAPPIWRDPGRPQMSFLYALAALGLLEAGFFVAGARGTAAMPWMYAANGVAMILIVATVSRISMRIVNGEGAGAGYLARPPRRNLATWSIALCTAAEFFLPGSPVAGWLALAAAAAILNLLNDWHIGRALLQRWALMLYLVYWLMAAGYAVMGASLLLDGALVSAGRHVLMAGAMSLAIFTVMCIAGRNHAGYALERRLWVVAAACAIVAAALLRVAAARAPALLALAGLVWMGGFALYLAHSWRILSGPRPDRADGCDGPVRAVAEASDFAC